MVPIRHSSSCWAASNCWMKNVKSVPTPAPRKLKKPARPWKSRKPTSRRKPQLKANRRKKKKKKKSSFQQFRVGRTIMSDLFCSFDHNTSSHVRNLPEWRSERLARAEADSGLKCLRDT